MGEKGGRAGHSATHTPNRCATEWRGCAGARSVATQSRRPTGTIALCLRAELGREPLATSASRHLCIFFFWPLNTHPEFVGHRAPRSATPNPRQRAHLTFAPAPFAPLKGPWVLEKTRGPFFLPSLAAALSLSAQPGSLRSRRAAFSGGQASRGLAFPSPFALRECAACCRAKGENTKGMGTHTK